MIRLKVSIVLLFIVQSSFAQLSADAIIKKSLSATGFDQHTIETFEISGYFKQAQISMKMQMFGVLPDLFKMQAEIENIKIIKANNENYSWEYNAQNDSVIFSEPETAKAENFYMHWTGGLNKYLDGEITAELMGVEKLQNIEVYKLKLKKKEKIKYYYIDKLSFLILKIEDIAKNESNYYMDYKNNNGLLLAHQIDGYKGDILVMSIIIENLKINNPIDKKIFNAPQN